MKKYIKFGLVLSLLALVTTAQAAEFIMPQGDDQNITVPAERRNVYTAGNNVNISNPVLGDLFAAGQVVTVASSVEEDLNAAGRTVLVTSNIGGDARLAGEDVSITSTVGGDVLAAGQNVSLAGTSSVGGDLVIGGTNVVIDSPVNGNVLIGADKVRINSRIVGEVKVNATTNLTFGPDAEVTGRIIYKGKNTAVVETGAQVSTVEFTRMETGGKSAWGAVKFLAVSALGLFLAAWLMSYYKPIHVTTVVNSTSRNPLMNLLIGLAAFILVPIVAVVLMFTKIGIYIGVFVLFGYALLLVLAGILCVTFVGSLIMYLVDKRKEVDLSWKSNLAGSVALHVLIWIPYIGGFVAMAVFLIYLMVLGSLVRMLKYRSATPQVELPKIA